MNVWSLKVTVDRVPRDPSTTFEVFKQVIDLNHGRSTRTSHYVTEAAAKSFLPGQGRQNPKEIGAFDTSRNTSLTHTVRSSVKTPRRRAGVYYPYWPYRVIAQKLRLSCAE